MIILKWCNTGNKMNGVWTTHASPIHVWKAWPCKNGGFFEQLNNGEKYGLMIRILPVQQSIMGIFCPGQSNNAGVYGYFNIKIKS